MDRKLQYISINDQYITTPEFDKFTAKMFVFRLKGAYLASKSYIANFVKKTNFDDKLKDLTNKNELNELSKKVKAVLTKGLTKDLIEKFSILNGAKYFSLGISQSHLVLIPTNKYIKYFTNIPRVESWKPNGMSKESIENITRPEMNFNGLCLIKNNISIPKKVINLYISYKLGQQLKNLSTDFTLRNCLFGSVKLNKNADPDKYNYTGYDIGFDSPSEFLFTEGSYGKNVTIFGELTCVHDCMLIIREKYLNSCWRTTKRIR